MRVMCRLAVTRHHLGHYEDAENMMSGLYEQRLLSGRRGGGVYDAWTQQYARILDGLKNESKGFCTQQSRGHQGLHAG